MGPLLLICIGKRIHSFHRKPSPLLSSVFDVMGANSCWVEAASPLPETRLEAETGARRSSHPDGGDSGQNVVLNILEVFVNRCRRLLANSPLALSREGREKGKDGVEQESVQGSV